MDNIIDIEAISKMPITKEYAEFLYGVGADLEDLKVKLDNDWLTYTSEYHSKIVMIDRSGGIFSPYQERIVRNAFQIVRYIDNYLNSLK